MKRKIFSEMTIVVVLSGAVIFSISCIICSILLEKNGLLLSLFNGVFTSYLAFGLFRSFLKHRNMAFERKNRSIGAILTLLAILVILLQIRITLLGWPMFIIGLILFSFSSWEIKAKKRRLKYEKRINQKINQK